MPTSMSGSKEVLLSGTFAERNMNVAIPFPTGFHGGKVILPFAANEFYTVLDQTLTLGTAVTLAAVVTNAVPILMGLVVQASGGSGTLRIRTTNLTDMFRVNADGTQPINLIFSPIGLVRENVEHGIHIMQASGTAATVRVSAWGYYGELP